MKLLIVNGDDFGAGRGVNRGVVEAHRDGILTSASLMVNMPGTEEAARLARELPALSVGIHVNLTNEGGDPVVALDDVDGCRRELADQLANFEALVGQPPTHVDSHHNVHRRPLLAPLFAELAASRGLPLREHSAVRYFPSFYGHWDGEDHLEHVSPESLRRMLRDEIGEGVTELACHPGYVEPDFASAYAAPREAELRTLCDPTLREALCDLGYRLIGYRELAGVLAPARDGEAPCRPS